MSGNLRIGFVGAGKMAAALAKGFAKTQKTGTKLMAACCPPQDAHLLQVIGDLGCETMHNNQDLVARSDVVVLAVKPASVPSVLEETKALIDGNKLLVSIAAGITVGSMENILNPSAKVIRAMPNTPSMVGEGATVYCLGKNCGNQDSAVVETLFSGVGSECHSVPESLVNAVTGISGSGPAYMFVIIEAMADAGVKQGLPRDLAYCLAAQTMVGAGKMVLTLNKHPAKLKDDVCSPYGSTISAIFQLEKNGIRTAMMQAVEAATERCHELGN